MEIVLVLLGKIDQDSCSVAEILKRIDNVCIKGTDEARLRLPGPESLALNIRPHELPDFASLQLAMSVEDEADNTKGEAGNPALLLGRGMKKRQRNSERSKVNRLLRANNLITKRRTAEKRFI